MNIGSNIIFLTESLARKINCALLFIHIGLLFTFTVIDAPVMICMNIISIIIYISLFKLIRKNLVAFLMVSYAEVLVHMLLATICMGWDCGFQLYCFAIIPIVYYCHYFAKQTNSINIHPSILCAVVILSFFVIRIYTAFRPALYHLDSISSIVIFTLNQCIVFAFIMAYMSLFSKMSLNIEHILQHSAEYDALTGLANRYKINSTFEQLCGKTSDTQTDFSIAIIDIDNFKRVNDTYGHNVGDLVLKNIAGILKNAETSDIYASRWGGEEFLVVVAGDNSLAAAKDILEQIRVNVAESVVHADSESISITVSCGIALHNKTDSIVTTVSRADSYLYEAKATGKNKVVSHD